MAKRTMKKLTLDQEIVLFCAFRYALGRMTYVVSSVCSELKRYYSVLTPDFRWRTSTEIQEYQDTHGYAGMDFDNDEWNKIKWLFDDSRIEKVSANYYMTDRWETVEAIRGDDGKYYSIPKMTEYYTVKKIE